ncbi:MAG: ketosteroid isomerase-like protein [Candidatus Aldehydirespiratoraceae bacterium]|jgi:ketosteroid isomerase-like protein
MDIGVSPHELQRLLDEREIVAVAVAYCFALDTHDWDALHQVFTPDATANLGVPARQVGIDEIIERISGALSGLDNSQHLVGNHEVVVTGDTATHRCYLQAQHIRAVPDGSPLFMIAGRYEDEFVRIPDGWRIGHRTLTTMWREGNSGVVQF